MLLNTKQLPLERILLGRRITTEPGLFAVLAGALAASDTVMADKVRDRLARRTARRPVSLGGGVALPHAAVPGLSTTRAVFVRSSTPIDMVTPDEMGVTHVLALLIPSPGLAADYDLLMSLTALLGRTTTRHALQHARTASEVQALFMNKGSG